MTTDPVLYAETEILIQQSSMEEAEKQQWLKALPAMTPEQLNLLIENLKGTRAIESILKFVNEQKNKLDQGELDNLKAKAGEEKQRIGKLMEELKTLSQQG